MANFPPWIVRTLRNGNEVAAMKLMLSDLSVNTACEEALCPNLNDCFAGRKIAFMILGNVCTRNCAFCSVRKGRPGPVLSSEAENIANAVNRLGIKYATITSVTRDDLHDGGARHYAEVIRQIRMISGSIKIEVLIPDFGGRFESVETVVKAGPDVLAHNVETVERLYPVARCSSDYARSLGVLRRVKAINARQMTKSGIMLGIGETEDEVYAVMDDLLKAQCDVLVIGQYLRPWHVNIPVERFVTPREFEHFRAVGEAKGFKRVISGPFARTSYGAEDVFKSVDGIAGSGHSKTEESPANADSIIRNEHKKMYWRMS